jgi:hypothetical protein
MTHTTIAQFSMKKIRLKEGSDSSLNYANLNISTLLQVYAENAAPHLIGDLYLKVDNKGTTVAEFYKAHDGSTKEYNTKIYNNYLLTFMVDRQEKYLIIEEALFGKSFALLNDKIAIIGSKENLIEIEVTDYIHEWGYDAPPEVESRSYFSDVTYTLEVKVKDVVESFSFSSSEIKDTFTIDLEDYSILILSDLYKESSCLIEMIVNKKEDK